MRADVETIIAAHRAAGRMVDVGGVATFVRDEGTGAEPVVCVHGVPVSSFLWRRLLPELASRGLRALAPDFPGLGLSSRPTEFDYSWTGLGRHLRDTLDALNVERFHLVVHDIGGPIGFEIVAQAPDRVASLTILNTMIEVDHFQKPWLMRPFGWPILGRVWLTVGRGKIFRTLMKMTGLSSDTTTTDDEISAHQSLLIGHDGGRAFLRIMQGFETTSAKASLYSAAVSGARFPVQVLWGVGDPFLTVDKQGRIAARLARLSGPVLIPGKHFFPEDSASLIADHIAGIVERSAAPQP